jgi:hypothetical protein
MQLLKFRSLSQAKKEGGQSPYDHTLDIIEGSHFKLSDPIDFNDPFDCNIPFDLQDPMMVKFLKATLADMSTLPENQDISAKYLEISSDPSLLKKNLGNWKIRQSIYKYLLKMLRVCSFSESQSISHPLLWAHYANSHDGVCFEVVAEPDWAIFELKYSETPPKFNLTTPDNQSYMDYVATKSPEWEHEKEFRVVRNAQMNRYINFRKESLKNVFFGVKVSLEMRMKLVQKIQSLGYSCGFHVMDLSAKNYALVSRPWELE